MTNLNSSLQSDLSAGRKSLNLFHKKRVLMLQSDLNAGVVSLEVFE
jgi:hypothetical protein